MLEGQENIGEGLVCAFGRPHFHLILKELRCLWLGRGTLVLLMPVKGMASWSLDLLMTFKYWDWLPDAGKFLRPEKISP